MPSCTYSKPHVLLHWTFAAIIIWATVTGFGNALLDLPTALADGISFINVSLTFMLIPLLGLRILCALDHQEPAHPNRALRLLAKVGHLALYVVTGLVLVTGVLMMERPINLFGLLSLYQPLQEPLLTEFFNRVHKYACVALAMLVVGHVAAVAVHHWRGEKLLQRMSL
ncbi:cytochrome b [Pseudomonas sp. Au-Pse12]|uniref:cytochrome b n=1 Tax=Pseudomonas sp. Au-Pse12 TaxID=2906459 RepID=UPI001E320054|nr:cytochrome b/b6 domain-containing protein [Pseudomonas sp. Au-Pse12]MCE4057122.1 cytochrome b/b6 domain-containing protein [Pseudomonas sp. Au-Pse12]